MAEATVREGVLCLRRPGARWLSTGPNGGLVDADAAYNIRVPEGWNRTDLGAYVAERRREAGFAADGPALLTGVDMAHARGARSGPVVASATVGLSNPAALPMAPSGDPEDLPGASTGTVNLLVTTSRSLDAAALANLLAVAVEAKAATLHATTGFPGTTSDAAVVGCDPGGEPATFAGSATPVGAATRACVREAIRASLDARYPDGDVPASVDDAEYGVTTERRAEVFRP